MAKRPVTFLAMILVVLGLVGAPAVASASPGGMALVEDHIEGRAACGYPGIYGPGGVVTWEAGEAMDIAKQGTDFLLVVPGEESSLAAVALLTRVWTYIGNAGRPDDVTYLATHHAHEEPHVRCTGQVFTDRWGRTGSVVVEFHLPAG